MARKIAFVSIHPQIFDPFLKFGVFASAKRQANFDFHIQDLREFAVDKHGSIDSSPFGGGDGMLMRPEPLAKAVAYLKQDMPDAIVVLLSPQGMLWRQSKAQAMAESSGDYIFICGRFAGIDQRFIDRYVDFEISLGDFVLAGGELAALCVVESMLRFVAGVLGNKESCSMDSFAEGCQGMLEAPQYTRPQVFEGQSVPEVLLSGNHQAIERWRRQESLELTKLKRPDLINSDG